MSNGIVTPEQFERMTDTNLKLDVLFTTGMKTQKTLEDNIKKTDKRFEAGNKRFEKVEKKALKSQLKDKGFSGAAGVVGGFIASWFRGP